jgi:hypothetical protein
MDNRKRTIELPEGVPTENAKPKIGDRMPDGTVYAGNLPDTGTPMYTTPADAPLTMQWREARDYAARLDAHGHDDWRLPSKAELNELFTTALESADLTKAVRFPPGTTGRPRRTATALRGARASVMATRSTYSSSLGCPSAASGDESFGHFWPGYHA